MRLLVVGGSGFLGGEVLRQAVNAGHQVAATRLRRTPDIAAGSWHRVDVRRRADVIDLVERLAPQTVVNAAFEQADWASTADGAANVAVAAAVGGARLIHVSSDAVFAGSHTPYDESALPSPVTPYGAAKAAAETAVRAISPTAAIARTSLIVGGGRSLHERHVHDLAAGRGAGVLFTDEIRCPVHVGDLAAALLELAATHDGGIQHVAGPEAISRHELGRLICRRDDLDPALLRSGLRATSGLPGAREVQLDGDATQKRLRTRLRGATEFLSPARPVSSP